ncbi:hypothetical protein [Kitasatospora sp. NPDC057500]|uniref:hypothetical protein n=1 Tax=Kitasatospora sp. NPDC057500 TaxID=3346151 RepID=UPI0036A9755F
MTRDTRIEQAEIRYEEAVFGGDGSGLVTAQRGLDGVEADLAPARGRLLTARFLADRVEDPRELELFGRAAALYRGLGDTRGEGEALFWAGTFHQVVRDDAVAALPPLKHTLALATRTSDLLTMSYALRHLGIAAHAAGRLSDESGRLCSSGSGAGWCGRR